MFCKICRIEHLFIDQSRVKAQLIKPGSIPCASDEGLAALFAITGMVTTLTIRFNHVRVPPLQKWGGVKA